MGLTNPRLYSPACPVFPARRRVKKSRRMARVRAIKSLIAMLAIAVPIRANDQVDFERDVRPIFAERCFRCHGPKKAEGGLRLDVRRRAMLGGDTGPALVAHQPDRGELLNRVTSNDPNKRMPPGGEPLTKAQIA